jgi:hypothetical protein
MSRKLKIGWSCYFVGLILVISLGIYFYQPYAEWLSNNLPAGYNDPLGVLILAFMFGAILPTTGSLLLENLFIGLGIISIFSLIAGYFNIIYGWHCAWAAGISFFIISLIGFLLIFFPAIFIKVQTHKPVFTGLS